MTFIVGVFLNNNEKNKPFHIIGFAGLIRLQDAQRSRLSKCRALYHEPKCDIYGREAVQS